MLVHLGLAQLVLGKEPARDVVRRAGVYLNEA